MVACVLLVAVACTGSAPATTAPSPGSSTAPSPSASEPARLVMQVRPAPYRLAAPVQREVAILDGRTVYLAGGLDSSDVSASGVFALNPATGRLTSLGSMTDAFHDGAGAMIGGKLFVFGGGTVSGTDVVQAFDLATHSSAVVGHLPVSLSDLSAVTVGDTTYLVGGYDGHAPRREIYATTDGTTFRIVGRLPKGAAISRRLRRRNHHRDRRRPGGERSGRYRDRVRHRERNHLVARNPSRSGHRGVGRHDRGCRLRDRRSRCIGQRRVRGRLDRPGPGSDPADDPLRQPVADAGAVSGPDGALLIGGSRSSAVDQVLTATLGADQPKTGPSPTPSTTTTSDAALVRPFAGLFLIADRGNNRLLEMNARKHIVWRIPLPTCRRRPHRCTSPTTPSGSIGDTRSW